MIIVIFAFQALKGGLCKFIVNVRKREIAQLKCVCCVNKMSEFASFYCFAKNQSVSCFVLLFK
ncbi:Hypothetical protein PAU_04255 [Photorhabdus asymbiotica]|uniref:Uncharacterized protein n=1 Tax=Photorhabdus asymbiotica subsp. asymbiotica (strain ATCC 43949 / 3105-77) TaxID=553480 RepID=B6VLU3_PHOAA|nr:Hypothetical protein PAU_04255 [Photorhabdus asymbiotica]CAR67123.1 Hypothetical protein PA-RVA9-1882 [Photorhabdus asymbiotica subsp. asymbiotica ATCC 43949]